MLEGCAEKEREFDREIFDDRRQRYESSSHSEFPMLRFFFNQFLDMDVAMIPCSRIKKKRKEKKEKVEE